MVQPGAVRIVGHNEGVDHQWRSIVPVWVLALGGAVAVVVFAPRGEAIGWFPVVLAFTTIAAFALQLTLRRKTGFVARVLLSVCGAAVLLALVTVVLAVFVGSVG
ncbi:hypothetical protein [Planctomonas psychrotolerans]|uniref:hypothetical protein n=1 Tax=Planctomonas psychrotolerans TaxID=2528712 RepID=UPI00123C0DD6|nr:hypothetical protein [Planctomonas psychrotolerans]